MRKLMTLLMTLGLVFFLAACGSSDDNEDTSNGSNADKDQELIIEDKEDGKSEEEQDDNAVTPETPGTDKNDAETGAGEDDEASLMEKIDYREFELEVEYPNDKEYEAELELKSNGEVEAEIEDELNDIEIEGSEAFKKLYPIVASLTIDENTSKDDAIKEVLEAFDLDADYKEFELEIEFKNGKEIEFEDER